MHKHIAQRTKASILYKYLHTYVHCSTIYNNHYEVSQGTYQ